MDVGIPVPMIYNGRFDHHFDIWLQTYSHVSQVAEVLYRPNAEVTEGDALKTLAEVEWTIR